MRVSRDGSVFEQLKEEAQQAVDCGQLHRAASLTEQALAWAREHGSADQIDHALCNRASINIHLGRGEGELPSLREILMRSGNLENCRLAAYHISQFYQLKKDFRKSLFYARIARDRAELLGVPAWRAASCNQVGNALAGDSFVDDASVEYERALDLLPAAPSVSRAQILHNLGYCRILQQRFEVGYTLLYQSLRLLRRLGGPVQVQSLINLDLCFAHLETSRLGHARRRGLAALRLGEKGDFPHSIKNALYLLGETANLSGDAETARSYFSRLQRDFFPDAEYLPGFLLAVDVRKLINLHA
jgi:tetratricopeptide (TPR) repeat protein